MKRKFSMVEEVRIEYSYETTAEQELLIENDYNGSFEEYAQDKGIYTLFDNAEFGCILDYLDIDFDTFCEEL